MQARLYAATGWGLANLTRGLAYIGGFLLVAMALTTGVSIIGRALSGFGLGPVKGDFELVEMGCALAVFAFLPWCQLNRGHVTVDLVADHLPPRIRAFLGLVGDGLMTAAAFLIFWQLGLHFGEKLPYGSSEVRQFFGIGMKPFFAETSYELAVPVWIPLGMALVAAFVFLLTCLFTTWRALRWTIAGREGKV